MAEQHRPDLLTRLGRCLAWLELVSQIRREREDLSGMSDQMLRDIGVTRQAVQAESRRSIFDIPANRLRRASRRQRQPQLRQAIASRMWSAWLAFVASTKKRRAHANHR